MILSLDAAAARDPKTAGGKAGTLARLRAAGFPVPDGCVVTEPGDAGSEAFAARVRDLAAAAGPDTRFAVRSSGHAEDSADASFAGQYETVLDVAAEDVPRAVAQCFASFAGAQARAYQERRGVAGAGGAVLVQQMIPATLQRQLQMQTFNNIRLAIP